MNYTDLEIIILSCLLQRPELMKDTILEDKYFIKHKNIWIFMKSFYSRFQNFDISLIMSICKNKYKMAEYITWLIEQEPTPSLFKQYEKQLIDLYNETKKEKWIIEKVYSLSNDLFVRNIKVSEYIDKVKQIYDNANELFKEEKNE